MSVHEKFDFYKTFPDTQQGTSQDSSSIHLKRARYHVECGKWHIFPVHVPVFDGAGTLLGCTCETYRRSDECKNNPKHRHIYLGPDGHCEQPGKCPAVRWGSKSTTDDRQLIKYWGRPWLTHPDTPDVRYYPNFGGNCGESGKLLLDADKYKDNYAGDTFFPRLNENTVTTLTGSKGTHLEYRMPEGKHYGNATGDLPEGIDIRGVGGYVVLPGSLHWTGNEYQFEAGYAPHEIEPLEVPAPLQEILDGAHGNRGRAADGRAQVGPSDIEAVQQSVAFVEHVLAHGKLVHSGAQAWGGDGRRYILHTCPFNPPDAPHADDAAAFVVIYQDGKIGAGCHHARCQKVIHDNGGSGWALLKHKVGYVGAEGDPKKGSEFDKYCDFIQSASGTTKLKKTFARPEGARKVLSAVSFLCRKSGSATISIGHRRLSEMCGMSHQAVGKILKRLAEAGFIQIETVEKGLMPQLTLAPCSQVATYSSVPHGHRVATYDQGRSFYRANASDDAYITAHAAYKKRRREMGLEDGTAPMGPAALLIVAHMRAYGQMSRSQIQASTGLGQGSITTALRRLVEYGQIEVVATGPRRTNIYGITDYATVALEALRPGIQTHEVGIGRKIQNLETVLARWHQRYPNRRTLPDDVRKKLQWMEELYEKLTRNHSATAAYLHRRVSQTVYFVDDDGNSKVIKPSSGISHNVRRHRRFTEENRYDHGEVWASTHKPTYEAYQRLADLPVKERYRYLEHAGYTRTEINAALLAAAKRGPVSFEGVAL